MSYGGKRHAGISRRGWYNSSRHAAIGVPWLLAKGVDVVSTCAGFPSVLEGAAWECVTSPALSVGLRTGELDVMLRRVGPLRL